MVKNNRFDQRIASIPSEIWSKIAQIDELKGQWVAGARLSPQVLGRLKRSVLITSTGASTRIEGAKLSDEDVEKLMRGIDIQKFTDRDKQEVKGYYELLENIFDSWKNLRFNESAIKHFHKELLKYVKKDEPHRGEYKKIENKVEMIDAAGKSVGTLFNTTPAYLTSKETQELVDWTQEALMEKKYHPLLVAGNFLVEFLQIHPFQDGNGRLSRVLTNLILLKEGYLYMPYVSHEKLVEDNKPEYYLALRQSQKTFKTDKGTIVPWLDFFLTIFLKQSRMAVELLSKKNIEKLLSKKQLSVWQYLQEADEATPGEIAKRAKVARPTVSQALDKLLRLKKVERIGLGRGTRYRKL
ncbi:MAG: Filamentation induced by cAMP protein Fic [Candidatus Giovannonibacteria bacterium GW2011_GWA2_44_26]|uniref:Filamentation induced by cAMP protein Fic n=1 Tax=Candidatus Giovannonibacteria bacterium GW2011_GWA2_44_26 TaxID=1618648 RepID=A0A0G1IP11_9BACT|nr:MAG: Filamentation induced by cAMP protein Fic [Candidatus Giovannonibacteria bacterium GW2011_GWA2_44_26]